MSEAGKERTLVERLRDVEDFVCELDGKTACIACSDGTFIDDGVIVADDYVLTLQEAAAELTRLSEQVMRLTAQLDGLSLSRHTPQNDDPAGSSSLAQQVEALTRQNDALHRAIDNTVNPPSDLLVKFQESIRRADAAERRLAEVREADRLDCEAWNERMWRDGGPIDPSPTVDEALNGGYGWLQVECSRCRAPRDVDLAALPHVATTCIHDLASRLTCAVCKKQRKRPAATLKQLARTAR